MAAYLDTNAGSGGAWQPAVAAKAITVEDAGEIRGAFGTVGHAGHPPAGGLRTRWRTLLAVLGPGLIVMVGDNDAGAFATYTQAGQNYGTTLLWTLLLLVPVLYVNQEMVLRLGVVTRVGHARLILQRFGKFWGAFSAIDLFALNALTVVTEFIGISLALDTLGVPRLPGVVAAAVLTIAAAGTGDFRRFERFAMLLVGGSFLLVPVFLLVHPPLAQIGHDFVVPRLPEGRVSDVLLLVIAIVGTTVAPWQLFFQQSYVIDKRITARFMNYEKADLWLGIVIVVLGAGAMMAFAAATFAGTPDAGGFTDAGGVAAGLAKYAGRLPSVLFALALLDASIIGAAAVSLSTAYATGDVLAMRHSLNRKPGEARGFFLIYGGLIAASAALVLVPGAPLGLITEAVQTLAGVLLPSATVFLLLLCNDRDVLGPWVNGVWLNLFTGLVIAVLLGLSVVLTASVLFPDLGTATILWLLGGSIVVALAGALASVLTGRGPPAPQFVAEAKFAWTPPPLDSLPRARLNLAGRVWMAALRLYLAAACAMVVVRVAELALHGG
jgi:Mn2+/Fe2+ NRAMP family transporter